MFAVSADVIVQQYEQPLNTVLKVFTLHHAVAAEEELLVLRYVCTVEEFVTHDELDVLFLQQKIMRQQRVLHTAPEITLGKAIEMISCLNHRVLMEPLDL